MKPKNVRIKKTNLGKHEVIYDCPGCGQMLTSSSEFAGILEHCPHCDEAFILPGMEFKQETEPKPNTEIENSQPVENQQRTEYTTEKHAPKQKIELVEFNDLQERKATERLKEGLDSKTTYDGFSIDCKEPINYISEGLMHLVSALILMLWMAILSSVMTVISFLNVLLDSGAIIVIAICIVFYLKLLLNWFNTLGKAYRAFENGSKAMKRKN